VRLQHAQQLDLPGQRQLADLVEEDGAGVRALELAAPVVGRAGERALLVAEQFGFEQAVRNRAAVDRDERLVGARPLAWITLAISSLPVPLSPSISTGRSVGAAFSAISSASSSLGLSPNVPSKMKLRSISAWRRSRDDISTGSTTGSSTSPPVAAAATKRSLCDSPITSSRNVVACLSSFSMSGRSSRDDQRSVGTQDLDLSIRPANDTAR
jgi:hypothetical protein